METGWCPAEHQLVQCQVEDVEGSDISGVGEIRALETHRSHHLFYFDAYFLQILPYGHFQVHTTCVQPALGLVYLEPLREITQP